MSFLSKAIHTVRNEGLGSLLNRSVRYAAYAARRAAMDKSATVREWESLKSKYSGRAFLIGNGPSLNLTPLYLLRGESTMCFNRFDLMMERLNWLPSFYTVIDDRVLLDTLAEVNAITAVAQHSFFPDIHPYNVDFRGRIAKRPNVHWLYLDRTSFSDRLPWCGINKTVANVGLQILAYLGFSEIYLLGMDMTYSIPKGALIENARDITATEDDDESHFDPRYFGRGRSFHVPMLDETFVKFREARRFFDGRGVRVINSTVGGKLEEFPRRPLSDVLGIGPDAAREAFRSLVSEKTGATIDGLAALESAPNPASPEDVSPDWPFFRTDASRANSFIMKQVFRFVPLGPCDNRYLFVSRQLCR